MKIYVITESATLGEISYFDYYLDCASSIEDAMIIIDSNQDKIYASQSDTESAYNILGYDFNVKEISDKSDDLTMPAYRRVLSSKFGEITYSIYEKEL